MGIGKEEKMFYTVMEADVSFGRSRNGDTLYEKNTGVGERMSLSGTGFDRTRRERGKV